MGEDDAEAQDALADALIARDFATARELLRSDPAETAAYRGSGRERARTSVDDAVDRLEAGEPVAAYFAIADDPGRRPARLDDHDEDDEAVNEAAVLTAIGRACEDLGELSVAHAAFEGGLDPLEAMRLEHVVALDPAGMADALHGAGVALYRKRLDADADDVGAREGLAKHLLGLGDYDAAIVEARWLVERHPHRPAGHHALIEAREVLEHGERAREDAVRATELCPDDADLWVKRGELEEVDGEGFDALGCHRRAVTIDPRHWEAHVGIARRLEMMGDEEGLASQLEAMLPLAGMAGEHDAIADRLALLRGRLAGGEAVVDAERTVAQRRREREAEIDELVRGPESEVAPGAGAARRAMFALIAVAVATLVLYLVTRGR